MLQRIRLRDFKSFVDEEVELAPLTLLVGVNASGKSNLLDAVWFLRGLTTGLEIDEVLDGEGEARSNGEPWLGLRGGRAEASRFGTTGFELKTVWAGVASGGGPITLRHEILCRTQPQALIEREGFGPDGVPGWASGPRSSSALLASAKPGPEGLLLLRDLSAIRQLAIRPERMRGYGKLTRPSLAPDGSNFSGALHHLCREGQEKQVLLDWLHELLGREIQDLDFIVVEELGDVMAVLVEDEGTRVSARSLSEGTLRFIGLALAVKLAPPGTVLLVEEVDSGLHPARIRIVVELLRSVATERGIQVIATTHAPACVEALDADALRQVIVCGRVPGRDGTILHRIGDLPHFEQVVARRGIAALFAEGWLEMAL